MLNINIIAQGKCTKCNKAHEMELKKVDIFTKETLPWIMFYTKLFELRKFHCCNEWILPTYVRVKEDGSNTGSLFSGNQKYKIGSEEVPVIIEETNAFAVTRTFKKQIEILGQIEKQAKLWEREKDDFFQKTYTYFTVHFEHIVDEMDHQELLDILRTFEDSYLSMNPRASRRFVYKGKNERKLIKKWIKKEIKSLAQAESDEMKRYLYFLIVDFFIQMKLIPQIHYLKWDVHTAGKMLGERLLTYLLISFPLTSYFSFMKDEAILRLTNKGHFQKELRQLLERTQKELSSAIVNNSKLQEVIESQKNIISSLEMKNNMLQLQNNRIEERLNETGNERLIERQSKKIKELKGIIKELQLEVKELREEISKGIEDQAESEEVENVPFTQELETYCPLQLVGKTIGIFGDIQGYQTEVEKYPCKILATESLNNPNALGILRESDVYVVLIQHISHSCMWSIKEYATQNNIPVLYSRHTNIEIIIRQVQKLLSKHE